MKREINKNDVLKDPHIKWNKFVELIACEGYDDMTKIQRKAHLVFYFEQEMQNVELFSILLIKRLKD